MTVQSITTHGFAGMMIDIECHVSNNLPQIVIVGYANKAVNEARERLRGAFSASHIQLPRKRITVNLAPADIPKADSGLDLGVAVAILKAGKLMTYTPQPSEAFIGELGLDGSLRAVRGIIGKLLAGRDHGLHTFYIPAANLAQAQLIPGLSLVPVRSLQELYEHLIGLAPLTAVETGAGRIDESIITRKPQPNHLSEIAGQDIAKRAITIAAAGGHNLLLIGPPGTGKSMLAKAVADILPPLSLEEMLEVTHIHSLAGYEYGTIMSQRPFRAPHHSASTASIIGGSAALKPGEISLSHRGVLLFDEFPEFGSPTLEALRQPLEDRQITVARGVASTDFPANFILVATANPCPCGYYGSRSGTCWCEPYMRDRYKQKLSGPIMDRIDLFCEVSDIDHTALLGTSENPEEDSLARTHVEKARVAQYYRFTTSQFLNSDMSNSQLKQFANMTAGAKQTLDQSSLTYKLSARAYMRTIKVARTIADLDGAASISQKHIEEALSYRHKVQ